MSSQKQPLFKLANQSLAYGEDIVLQGVNLTISAGEKIALVGRSGSGKSTLLRHLRELAPHQVSWCPQHPALVPMLSAFHNIYAGTLSEHSLFTNLLNLVWPQTRALQTIGAVAKPLGLDGLLGKSVEQLSGGQQQRVGLGRAFIQDRTVFLGDEPVSAVDEYQGGELIRLVAQKYETTVIALHDVDQALAYATRVIGLDKGRICMDVNVADASAEDIATLYSAVDDDES